MSITAEDIQTRGFSSVAEVLQQSSLTTGGLQGGQTSGSFTQGAEAAGMAGPGYTKYLINGRLMLSYPALYNGSERSTTSAASDRHRRAHRSPAGRPPRCTARRDRRRGQHHPEGRMDGGTMPSVAAPTPKAAAATSASAPPRASTRSTTASTRWSTCRSRTAARSGATSATSPSRTTRSATPQLPSNDFAGYRNATTSCYMMDPSSCANVQPVRRHHHRRQARRGDLRFGVQRRLQDLKNGKNSGQFYSSMTFDVNDNFQLFADVLYSKKDRVHLRPACGGALSVMAASTTRAFGKVVNLQRAFAPEESARGHYNNILNSDESRAYQALGGKGMVGDWDCQRQLHPWRVPPGPEPLRALEGQDRRLLRPDRAGRAWAPPLMASASTTRTTRPSTR
jgi:hypothetical protein